MHAYCGSSLYFCGCTVIIMPQLVSEPVFSRVAEVLNNFDKPCFWVVSYLNCLGYNKFCLELVACLK